MDNKDYVSLDVAKKLVDIGYNETCQRFYCRMYDSISDCVRDRLRFTSVTYKELEEGDILVPSLYEMQKWFRDNGIEVSANFDRGEEKWFFFVQKLESFPDDVDLMSDSEYDSYEEALDRGINEALKFIE